ncbi:MAG: catalase, partial [Bdellovibrionia bacterium]
SGNLLTTNQGLRISDNHNSLKIGPRGPSLLEDFVLREKITSFDHERIPERVVHARGSAAFGYFECTADMKKFTSAGFLSEVGKRTPVLTRFSTVAGSRGSMDTARDARGFAVKFYTEEGNYDLVGNNIPVFFIQDAMKFPDLVHAVKPEQDNEIPQASSAHDTFWDFISLMPESLHMVCWMMSDRAIPRSLRMMEGFGVHTFRLVNAKGVGTFVKFHWKPVLGVHSLLWEESQMLGGLDPDFHRRDLWETINSGTPAEWELGVQLVPEADEFKFSFDLLDPTKLIPEELVPVKKVGRLVLNRNPDNFFAEVEQAAFHPGHLVPGIDFTNDPLLQGRLFSYTDTQLTRLGGPNFHELPVNRPLANVHNNNRDGLGRQTVPKGKVAYDPNSLKGGCPFHAKGNKQQFINFAEKISGHKVRARSSTFEDHTSQAKLFFDSQSEVEQNHIRDAFIFELSKVETVKIRYRMTQLLLTVNEGLASEVAHALNLTLAQKASLPPSAADRENNIVPGNRTTKTAISDGEEVKLENAVALPESSKALSILKNPVGDIKTRKVAFLATIASVAADMKAAQLALQSEGAVVEYVVPQPGVIKAGKRGVEKCLASTPSHSYDAVFIFAAPNDYEMKKDLGLALRFVGQAFKHCKTIGSVENGLDLLNQATLGMAFTDEGSPEAGITTSATKAGRMKSLMSQFIAQLRLHRHWERELPAKALPF